MKSQQKRKSQLQTLFQEDHLGLTFHYNPEITTSTLYRRERQEIDVATKEEGA